MWIIFVVKLLHLIFHNLIYFLISSFQNQQCIVLIRSFLNNILKHLLIDIAPTLLTEAFAETLVVPQSREHAAYGLRLVDEAAVGL